VWESEATLTNLAASLKDLELLGLANFKVRRDTWSIISQKNSLEACIDSDMVIEIERTDWVSVVSGFSVFRHWILESEVSGLKGFSAATRGLAEFAAGPEPSLRSLEQWNVTWIDADPVIISSPIGEVDCVHCTRPIEGNFDLHLLTACVLGELNFDARRQSW
jgi:hypothetical protein